MKRMIKTILSPIAVILQIITAVFCPITKWLNYYMYKLSYIANWKIGKGYSWFDHDIDVFYLWDKRGETGWLERGFFSQLAISAVNSPKILELGCGNGFHTRKFYGQSFISCKKGKLSGWGGGRNCL